jgi:hydrophobic/amphiphilic exporter-1 (mainly G- bacteria), HAE1 family
VGLTRAAIHRPLALLMLIFGLVLLGSLAYLRIPKDRFPAISFPYVAVQIAYRGAAPIDVEMLVARPIEQALAEVEGVTQVSSVSREGLASITLQFNEDTDTDLAAADVERQLAAIADRLPPGVDRPQVLKADTSDIPIMNVSLGGARPLVQLHTLATETVLPLVQAVPNVADVTLVGGVEREIQVKVSAARLQAHNLSLLDVSRALAQENINTPAGRLEQGDSSQGVRVSGRYETVEDLLRAPVTTGQSPVQLHQVATVTDGHAEQLRLHRLNGSDAVGFTITKQANANGIQVSDDLHAALERARSLLPPDVELVVTSDSASFTRSSLDATVADLKLAVLVTAIVLLLFLHTWRPTAIVLLSIPTSLISTFLVMYFGGFSLNMFSLIALALCIGILVDDSIVVLENIQRHLEAGESPEQAALLGRQEIGLAALTITLVDVAVYLPVTLMSGNTARVAREFGVTMAAATLFSLFISFTLTPMLAARFLRKRDRRPKTRKQRLIDAWNAAYDRLALGYRRLLDHSLQPRGQRIVLAAAGGTFVLSLLMLRLNLVGSEYAPQEDDARILLSITTQPGTSIAGTDAVVRKLEQQLQTLPEVQTIFTSVGVGGGLGLNVSVRNANVHVDLTPKNERTRTISQLLDQIRAWSVEHPGVQLRLSVANPLAGGARPAIEIEVLGDDFERLRSLAASYEALIRATGGAVDVVSDAAPRDPEIRAEIDHLRLADLGVSATTAADTLRTAVGGTVATQFRPSDSTSIDLRVMADGASRSSLEWLGGMPVQAAGGTLVRLDQIAKVRLDSGPAEIRRSDRQRVITITGNVAGRSPGEVIRDIRAASASIPLPEGYRVVHRGDAQRQDGLFATLISTLALSLVLVYMLLVALYESFLTPLSIMFSIPVALVGAILGLFLTQNTLNIFSAMAAIMLMGLVGKNAILLIDCANTLRQQGLVRHEALLEAGYQRLRPILMTTATIVFSMLPLTLKLEAGGESRSPMASVIIGGVISSTLLSLVLVPVVYVLLEDGTHNGPRTLARRWRALRFRGWPEPTPSPAPAASLPGFQSIQSGSAGE